MQSGFRTNLHSCETEVTLTDGWMESIDKGKLIGTIFLDLRKAFDLVNHDILLQKIGVYQFSNTAIITSYLKIEVNACK